MITKLCKGIKSNFRMLDDDMLLCTVQARVKGYSVKNNYQQIFSSESLSNMYSYHLDTMHDRMMIYNTSGHAFIYQIPELKLISPKIYLKVMDLGSEDIISHGRYYLYYDSQKQLLHRLSLNDYTSHSHVKISDHSMWDYISFYNNQLHVITGIDNKEMSHVNSSESIQSTLIECFEIDADGGLTLSKTKRLNEYIVSRCSLSVKDLNDKVCIIWGDSIDNGNYIPLIYYPEKEMMEPLFPNNCEVDLLEGEIATDIQGDRALVSSGKTLYIVEISTGKVLEYHQLGDVHSMRFVSHTTAYANVFDLNKNEFWTYRIVLHK